jgi:hypothetical protein
MSERSVKIFSPRHRKSNSVRANQPGDVLRCLLLARGPEWVAVDVTTGAVVRSHASGWPVVPTDSSLYLEAYRENTAQGKNRKGPELDVIDIELAADDEPLDPARPEAVMVRDAPQRVGTGRRRATRRVLEELLPANPKRPLLGSLGPSIAYADLDGSKPSVALVEPDRTPTFFYDEGGTWCHFALQGRKHRLGVVDERVLEALRRVRALGESEPNAAVANVIGGTPKYLVVALGAPRQSQAPKLVLSVLPRP